MDTRKSAARTSFVGFLFTVIAGSLLHFAFAASGGSTLIGTFAPVNESVWEHLKLLLFPALIFAAVEYYAYGANEPSFFAAKSISILIGLASTVMLFYTYTGIAGDNYLPADIAVFVVSVAVSYFVSFKLMKCDTLSSERVGILAIGLLAAVIILFIYFTFTPPVCELFRDPVTEGFGIPDSFYATTLIDK